VGVLGVDAELFGQNVTFVLDELHGSVCCHSTYYQIKLAVPVLLP